MTEGAPYGIQFQSAVRVESMKENDSQVVLVGQSACLPRDADHPPVPRISIISTVSVMVRGCAGFPS